MFEVVTIETLPFFERVVIVVPFLMALVVAFVKARKVAQIRSRADISVIEGVCFASDYFFLGILTLLFFGSIAISPLRDTGAFEGFMDSLLKISIAFVAHWSSVVSIVMIFLSALLGHHFGVRKYIESQMVNQRTGDEKGAGK